MQSRMLARVAGHSPAECSHFVFHCNILFLYSFMSVCKSQATGLNVLLKDLKSEFEAALWSCETICFSMSLAKGQIENSRGEFFLLCCLCFVQYEWYCLSGAQFWCSFLHITHVFPLDSTLMKETCWWESQKASLGTGDQPMCCTCVNLKPVLCVRACNKFFGLLTLWVSGHKFYKPNYKD